MSESGLPQSPVNMELQQHRVSPNRWNEEAVILMECVNITIEDSKNIEQEIKESPFETTIYSLLRELYNERESTPSDLMETARDSTGVTANMQKLDEILKQENITTLDEDVALSLQEYEDISSTTLHAYKAKLSQIRLAFELEHQKIETLCEEYEKGMLRAFRDQPKCIPITQEKVDTIIQSFRERSQFIYLELKTNVAEAVLNVKRGMLDNKVSKRRKRNFSKQATEILNEYFYSHLDSPYPCEEVKTELASQCNISMGQVNNWFGNKRIRYKRNIGKENSEEFEKLSPPCDSGDLIGMNEDLSSSEDDIVD